MKNMISNPNKGEWASAGVILLLFLLLPWFSPAHACGQEQEARALKVGHLEGFIYRADGETPLEDARVILEQMEKGKKTGEIFESNITGETGEYKLQNIPVGFYKGKIMVKNKRYKIKRLDFFVHVFAGETNFLSFTLKRIKGKGRRP